MMPVRSAFLPLLLGIAAPALAQSGVSALKGHNSNAPVDVAADRIELQDRANRAIFSGNVKVRQGNMTIDSARMTVVYANAGGNPQVQRIDATGGVIVTSPSETARGSLGIYDLNRRLITLLGNVTLVSGSSSVNGGRLLIDLNSGRATVDGNSVGAGGTGGGGRVTGRFTVPQRNN
jgi:lipopolysaccharide export system protein LptA